jgi:cytochrome P450 / NADPH-cytochrome P450 reductase
MAQKSTAFAQVPQPRAYPFVGNAPSIDIEAPVQSMMKLARELGPVYRLQFPSQTALVVGDHRLVDELSDASRFEKIVHAPLRQLRDLGGDALFTADNDDPAWAIAHRLLMPAFGAPAMRRYWADMVDITGQLVTKWDRLGPNVDHDVADNMTRLTLDTIALSGFSYRFNSYYQREMHPFVDSMVRALGEAGARSRRLALQSRLMLATRRQYERDLALMYDVVDGVIRERKSQPHARDGAPKDLLDLLLADGALTDVQVRFQIMTFLIAGHETTSGLLSFTIYQLLRHPDVMANVVAEVDRVLGGDRARVPQFEDVAQLRYLDQTLRESLRLWPTAPAFGLTAKADTLLGGEIPVHHRDVVLVLTPVLHRDPAVWSDPEVFDPDRFAPGRAEAIPANAWKPFGTGERACIGRQFAMQEATLVLAALLWHFELSDPYGYELKVKESLTLKPEGLVVRARRRTPAVTVAAPVAVASTPPVALPSHATPLLVLYGSNSGSSQDFAERIAREAARRGYAPTLAPLDDHAGALPRAGAVVIVTGSYNGQPPDNARRFVQWLDAIEPGALAGVRYAVLGCGHRDWASTYQAVPRRIEARLVHAGARPLHARGEADAGGDFFGAFETWSRDALASLDAELGVAAAPAADVPVYQIERVDNGAHAIAAAYGAAAMTVLENRELVQQAPGEIRSKRHLEIELPAGVTYRAGDYLAVLPENEATLVRRAAARFQLAPDDTIVVHRTRETSSLLPVDRPITVAQLLARFVELKAPATRSDLRTLAANTPCPPEANRLLALAGDAYEADVLAKRVSILDLLERFASTALPFARFLELLPPMKPRRYSIASSPLAVANRCALAVAVLDAPAWSGTGRYRGTCSNHLAELAPGATFFGTVVSPNTPFFLPADPQTPLLFIGAGTGIAPFRGFIEERAILAATGTRLGPADLFFGCDHPDVDFLYADELTAWEQLGAVSIRPAFFRRDDEFVQHRLWRDRARVAELLAAGARIYVCGDGKRMAPAVRDTLERIQAEHACISAAAAREWLHELEATGRYVADVFSG